MGITVIGSLNYDLVTYTNRIPHAGETYRANSFETHAGGKGLNQAIALAKQKQTHQTYTVRMIGNVGSDSFGVELLEILKSNGVNVSGVKSIKNESTGTATIIVEKETGQNRILLNEGANGKTEYSAKELRLIFSDIELQDSEDGKSFVVLQHEIPDPGSIILWLKKNYPSHQIIFNPSPFKPLAREVWNSIDVLIINEIEALQIMESLYAPEDCKKYHDAIQKNFINGYDQICELLQRNLICKSHSGCVVVTLGSKGALYCSKTEKFVEYIPCINDINVVDTTGAGDTFLGALVTQIYQGSSLDKAVEYATVASSITIQRKGAAESIPSYMEVLSDLQARKTL